MAATAAAPRVGKAALLAWASSRAHVRCESTEDLRDGTLVHALLLALFPALRDVGGGAAKAFPVKRKPKYEWEVGLNWESIWRMVHILRLPADLFEKEGLQAGRFRPVFNLLVALYFLYHVAIDHDFTADFAHPIDGRLAQFLQSRAAIDTMLIGGMIEAVSDANDPFAASTPFAPSQQASSPRGMSQSRSVPLQTPRAPSSLSHHSASSSYSHQHQQQSLPPRKPIATPLTTPPTQAVADSATRATIAATGATAAAAVPVFRPANETAYLSETPMGSSSTSVHAAAGRPAGVGTGAHIHAVGISATDAPAWPPPLESVAATATAAAATKATMAQSALSRFDHALSVVAASHREAVASIHDEYEAQAAQLQQLQEEVQNLRRRDQTLWSALAASGQLVPEVEREIERETAREAAHKAAREGKAAESARASAALRVLAKRAGGDEVDVEPRSDLTRTSTDLRAAADAELTLCEITIGSKRERMRFAMEGGIGHAGAEKMVAEMISSLGVERCSRIVGLLARQICAALERTDAHSKKSAPTAAPQSSSAATSGSASESAAALQFPWGGATLQGACTHSHSCARAPSTACTRTVTGAASKGSVPPARYYVDSGSVGDDAGGGGGVACGPTDNGAYDDHHHGGGDDVSVVDHDDADVYACDDQPALLLPSRAPSYYVEEGSEDEGDGEDEGEGEGEGRWR